jgi:hypothetical protein
MTKLYTEFVALLSLLQCSPMPMLTDMKYALA